jgi:hypothetical protein
MGFHIVQNTPGDRYIVPSATFMQHRASGGVEGQFNGSLNVRLNAINRSLDVLEGSTATRVGMSLSAYREAIKDEWWGTASDALKLNVADSIILGQCDMSLSGTREHTINSLFGSFTVIYSKCPLITAPLAVKAPESVKLNEYLKQRYQRPTDFVVNYIETEKYKQVLK